MQGGNALDANPDALDVLADRSVVRVTLVHLTGSSLGATSAPSRGTDSITNAGRDAVRKLESMRVLVDLAPPGDTLLGVNAMTKIMGFLIMCMGVQFVVNGILGIATDPELLRGIKSVLAAS